MRKGAPRARSAICSEPARPAARGRAQRRLRGARGRQQGEHARPRPAGAASRLDRLQTPPSTYSRPPISHRREDPRHRAGGQHRLGDRRARGRPARRRHARAARAVDGDDPQAAVEARAEGVEAPEVAERALRPRGRAQHRGAREPPPGACAPARAGRAGSHRAASPRRRARGAERPGPPVASASPRARALRGMRPLGAARCPASGRLPGGQVAATNAPARGAERSTRSARKSSPPSPRARRAAAQPRDAVAFRPRPARARRGSVTVPSRPRGTPDRRPRRGATPYAITYAT